MELPSGIREDLIDELDQFLDSIGDPDAEQVVNYLLEQLEVNAEDHDLDDIVAEMEDEGGVDGSLAEVLESELESTDDFEFTGEEVVRLLERVVGIEWDDSEVEESSDDVDDDDDF